MGNATHKCNLHTHYGKKVMIENFNILVTKNPNKSNKKIPRKITRWECNTEL